MGALVRGLLLVFQIPADSEPRASPSQLEREMAEKVKKRS